MAQVSVQRWPTWPAEPVGGAIVLPGVEYTIDHPLMWWTCQVLAENGWGVVGVRWEVDEEARRDAVPFVASVAERALEEVDGLPRTLVVGKSLGTCAAPWAAEAGMPGVWLTPVLTYPVVAQALVSTTAPGLLVGGTADGVWDSRVAGETGLQVLEIDDADHILYGTAGWRASFDALRDVLEAIETFAEGLT